MTGKLMLLLTVVWPLALVAGLAVRRSMAVTPWWSWLVALSPLPALIAAIAVPDGAAVELSWLLLGSRWEIDSTRRALLAATALVWLLAGWQMRTRMMHDTHRLSLQLGWLLALVGNVGVMLVHDVAGLYAFFALMSFSAYPLVVHTRTDEAMSAGRVYLIMTVLGEVLILTGLIIASRGLMSPQLTDLPATLAASPMASVAVFCMWTGFGVKTAVAGLHLWLPGAYTHAPPPVVAVLGGAMINAGVLGLLLTLPLGALPLTTVGAFIVGTGLVGAFGGAVVGVTQSTSTTVLGYSSISQMGLLMIPLGAALYTPSVAPESIAAITLFAVHHGLAKASLFLGVDVARRSAARSRPVILGLLLFVGASLSGAPFTSGAAAKLAIKHSLEEVFAEWPWLSTVFSLAAAGTTVLVLRAVWCLSREPADREATGAWPPSWLLSVALVMLGVWGLPFAHPVPAWPGASLGDATTLLWPIVLGVALAGAAMWAAARNRLGDMQLPSGDLLLPVSWIARAAQSLLQQSARATERTLQGILHSGTISSMWSSLLTRLRVAQPDSADRALRSVAPIVFGLLIAGALLLLRR